ncbi:MAG TPA: LPS assembly protein LptD [Rudaea sp.]|nr:LPS assembly protein LptD [Rudaea sp.]
MIVPSPYAASLLRPRLAVLALAVAFAHGALADEVDKLDTVCPVGVLKCPKKSKKDEYAMCKRNDLLDFYTPGLPTEGDRSTAPSDLSARKVSSTDRTHYKLENDVRLQRLDQLLRSDFLTFDTETTDYTADGHVRMQDRSMLLSADHAHGTGTPSTTFLDNVRYQMLEQRGNGTAETANMTDPDHGKLHEGTYSTCDPDDRRWYVRGKDLEVDYVENEAKVHGATMYYGDVPFFWFPYLSFPLSNDRETGFLVPHVGYGTRRGLVLGAPYYLNLAPNYDATIEPRVSTKRGAELEGQFRYLDATDHAQIDFNYAPHDNEVGDELNQYAMQQALGEIALPSPIDIPTQRYSLRILDTSYLSANWGASVNINRVSDKQYFQDYGSSLTSSATSLLSSSAYLNGRGEWWTASVGGDAAQVTEPYVSEAFQPYQRLPRATFQGERAFAGPVVWGLNSEYVNFQKGPYDIAAATPYTFQHIESLEGQRVDLYPYLALPIETAGYFIRPEIGVRYTTYDLRNVAGYARTNPGAPQFADRTPSRTVPIFDIDAGLVFERETNLFGNDLTQTLEPRLYYLRVPYRNQNDLPIFDTQLPTFDFPSLFRSNAFTGADRQSNANDLTVAVTSRLIDNGSGDDILSASLGQIRYFDAQRVQLPGYPAVDFSGSDYVAELDLHLNDRWDFKWDQQYNPNSRVFDPATAALVENLHHTDLSAFSVEHRFGGDGIVNFSYRFRRGLLEQVDTTALVPINASWSIVGRYYYSLMTKQLLEAFGGAEYDSCCVAMRFLLRHYINSIGQLHADTAIYFEVEFKGLGSSGTRTENFLRRSILGFE